MTKKTLYAMIDAQLNGKDPISVLDLTLEDLAEMAKEDPARYNELLIYS